MECNRSSNATGDATDGIWIELLKNYLPERYRIDRAFVIDSTDTVSRQIDVVIYDRQYTPLIFEQDGTLVMPAEDRSLPFDSRLLYRRFVRVRVRPSDPPMLMTRRFPCLIKAANNRDGAAWVCAASSAISQT
ncbi:DUF6602 domain-containing protein [Bradyrhizobium sp. SZCCHNR2028]|uniref:DUF6602 domain-containing protein n=1 Tax=Bradyrhizobium sp. SZCCHNR2028 TaxID=3057382 RepID=UPI00396577D6